MKFGEQWLREWVDPPVAVEELVERLTMTGFEVDSVVPAAPDFTSVVIGEVMGAEPHPSAERLQVCRVNDGDAIVDVVCGAPNVRAGMRSAFARVGAVLPGGRRVAAVTIRDADSNGMLCSAAELGLSDEANTIVELPAEAPVGVPLQDYLQLDDNIIDIELTPNRGDCLSIAGIAREVGAAFGQRVQRPDIYPVAAVTDTVLPVELVAEAQCPVYVGRAIHGVDVNAASPLWVQERLRRCGIRSISVIVDITNYVMMELGQPLHAFDLDKLDGGIRVRLAESGDRITLLDGQEIELQPGTLLITDHSGPIAMAGIMGGNASGVGTGTRNIFFEAAFFSPQPLAGRARAYKLQTDASYRFERGVSFDLQAMAIERATALVLDICGGEPGPVSATRAAEQLPERKPVVLRAARLDALLGFEIDAAQVERHLSALDLDTRSRTDGWEVRPPPFRFDIAREADLIEEVVRMHGYDRMPVASPNLPARVRSAPEGQIETARYRDVLIERGFAEIVSYSFVDPGVQARFVPGTSARVLANPIASTMSVMRTSLWPGLVQACEYNLKRQQDRALFCELGSVFADVDGRPSETPQLAMLMTGNFLPEQWGERPGRTIDFFDMRGEIENLLALQAPETAPVFAASEHAALHPGQRARVLLGGRDVAEFGALHPEIAAEFDIPSAIFLAQIVLKELYDRPLPSYTVMSKYPTIRRDISILVDREIAVRDVLECLRSGRSELLRDLQLFDVYAGEGIDSRKKSLTLGLTFQGLSSTLRDEEVDAQVEQAVRDLARSFGATLR